MAGTMLVLVMLLTRAGAQSDPALLWSKISGPWASEFDGSFGAIAVHPTNPNIMLIGSSVLGGPGVLKSSDGGVTWTAKNSGIQKLGLPAQNYPPITKIVFSPSDPNVIYFCSAVDGGLLPGGTGYIYKSGDGGETWQKINGQQNILGVYQIQNAVLDLDVNPQNPNIVYAAIIGQGIMKTTDSGTDWTTIYSASPAANELDYFNIVRVSPTDPNTVFFSGFHDIVIGIVPTIFGEIPDTDGLLPFSLQKSTDGGSTWTPAANLPQAALFTDLQYEKSSGNWYVSTIAYKTTLWFPEQNFGIFKSSNSGQNWQAINQATFGSLDQMPFVALTANPSSVNKGIFASSGFGNLVVASTDTGIHWLRLDPCLLNAYLGKTALAGNKFFVLTSLGIYFTDISSLYAPATPTITSVSPATLPPSASPQLITITGSYFLPAGDPNASTLEFYDPANNIYNRTPINVTSTSMQYNLTVQSATGTWKVKVLNGSTESLPFSFAVVAGTAQLNGLSISGPAAINENGSGQFTATASFTDGSQQTVTSSVNWSENSSVTTISSSGLLSAGSVNSDTVVTVSASYTTGGITKTANANVTVANSANCGVQIYDLMVNGNFASGSSSWTLTGSFQADSRFASCYSCHGYSYLANADGSGGNNLSGTMIQYVTIPANTTSATLGYYYRITTSDSTTVAHDHLSLNLVLNGGGTLVGMDDLSNVNASSGYVFRSFNVTAYRGQTVGIKFLANTDASGPTVFRVDDVSLVVSVPNPVTPVLFGVGGPTNVAEGSTAQYNAIVVNCDGSIQSVTPTWSENSSATSISAAGLLTAGSVSSDTSVTVTATYGSFTLNYPITVMNIIPTFSSLVINGPSALNENSSGQFTATAVYSDGSSLSVSPNWSEDSAVTSISGSGLLTAGEVGSDTIVTVSASYTIGGVARNASQPVTVINVPPPPTLTSLNISGSSSVNENSSSQFSAAALFSDGSSQVVNPVWSEDLATASISTFGLFSAGEVTSNTLALITASFTTGGITCNASNSVTVLNIVPPSPTISFKVSGNQIILSWPTNFVGFTIGCATNLPTASWTSNSKPSVIVGQQYMVTNSLSNGKMFFRLEK